MIDWVSSFDVNKKMIKLHLCGFIYLLFTNVFFKLVYLWINGRARFFLLYNTRNIRKYVYVIESSDSSD